MYVVIYGCTIWNLRKQIQEKVRYELHKNITYCFKNIQGETPHKIAALRPHNFHLENNSRKTKMKCRALLKKKRQIQKWRLLTVIEVNKGFLFKTTTEKCWTGPFSFPLISPLTLNSLSIMTIPTIKPQSPGPVPNVVTIIQMERYIYIYIHIYSEG